MRENLLGTTYPERKKLINDLLASEGKSRYEYPMKFQGRITPFKVFVVPLDVPKYRLGNGRTKAAQFAYLAKNPQLPENFFTSDDETIAAHKAQHELLKALVAKDLMKYFEKETQDQPLILDHEGFVINGNRRLCTYRELFYRDPDRYKRFSHIEVIILPPCSERDKDELEAELQIKKDIKAKYDWVSEALMLKERQEEYDYSTDDLSNMYGLTKNDVARKLSMLKYGDEYLLKRGQSHNYKLIVDDEFAFKSMVDNRKKFSNRDEIDKSLLKDFQFMVLLDNQQENQLDRGRVYNVINEITTNFDALTENLSNELDAELKEESTSIHNPDLNLFGEGNAKENNLITLSKLINKDERASDVLDIIQDTLEQQKNKKREKTNKDACLNKIQKANSELNAALNIFNNSSTTKGILEQLEQICQNVQQLKERLANEINN